MNNNALISMKKDLPRQILINLFTTTLSESYKQEMCGQKLKRKEFQKILEKSPYYQDWQTWELQLKSRRREKYGLALNGEPWMIQKSNKAVERCILSLKIMELIYSYYWLPLIRFSFFTSITIFNNISIIFFLF